MRDAGAQEGKMNSHKKHEEVQKGKDSNDWNFLCSSRYIVRSSVGAGGGRACKGDKSSSKKGAAIVELALAMLLMMSMIAFSVFVCRALSERNRSLAASRTVAWLYSHADEPEGKDAVWQTKEFTKSLAEWHFTHPAVVNVTIQTNSGLIAQAQQLVDKSKEIADGAKKGDSPKEANDDITIFGIHIKGTAKLIKECFDTFVTGAVNFLTQDFTFCEAKVTATVPLTFGVGFYQLFGWFTEMDSNSQAILKPEFCSSCVMPMQSGGNGVGDPFGALAEKLNGIMDWLKKLVEKTQEDSIYRPFDLDPDQNTIDKDALYALLIFEIDEKDHAPLKTESPGRWGAARWGNTIPVPEYTLKSRMDVLLDQCAAKKYTGNYGQ